MAATSGAAQPIIPRRIITNSQGQAQIRRMLEKATQSFLAGTPVQVDVAGATGYIIACPAIVSVATANIAGFSAEPGHNLTTSGVGTGSGFGGESGGGGPAGGIVYGSVQNQPSASLLAVGSPIVDGATGLHVADNVSTFIGVFGDSNNDALAVLAQAMVGAIFGLTLDAGNNYWYVDNHIVTTAAGACVEVLSLIDPIGTLHGKVEFRVLLAAQQLGH